MRLLKRCLFFIVPAQVMRDDAAKFARIIKSAGIKVE